MRFPPFVQPEHQKNKKEKINSSYIIWTCAVDTYVCLCIPYLTLHIPLCTLYSAYTYI